MDRLGIQVHQRRYGRCNARRRENPRSYPMNIYLRLWHLRINIGGFSHEFNIDAFSYAHFIISWSSFGPSYGFWYGRSGLMKLKGLRAEFHWMC
jgi:hypothetical protein